MYLLLSELLAVLLGEPGKLNWDKNLGDYEDTSRFPFWE
jgi:hypothetical protein